MGCGHARKCCTRHSFAPMPDWLADPALPRPRQCSVGSGCSFHGHLSLGLPAQYGNFQDWEGSLHPVNAYHAATVLARLGPVGPPRPSFPWMRYYGGYALGVLRPDKVLVWCRGASTYRVRDQPLLLSRCPVGPALLRRARHYEACGNLRRQPRMGCRWSD